jgi:hypothetical protein
LADIVHLLEKKAAEEIRGWQFKETLNCRSRLSARQLGDDIVAPSP